jgi:hypothetical protein
MSNTTILELLGDNIFVILTLLGTVAIIGYLWVKFADKSRSRYKS